MFGTHRALAMRAKAATLSCRMVTTEEFIRLATAAGIKDPEGTARISVAFGSQVMVGDEMLAISDGEK